MKVLIVGAGISGLTAAYRLQKKGVDVTVLEEKDSAGGRIRSSKKDGYILDLGAQFFLKYYDTTFALCEELGLKDEILPYPSKMALWKDNELQIAMATLDPKVLWKFRKEVFGSSMGLGPFGSFSLKSKLQLAKILIKVIKRRRDLHFINFENALDLDNQSLAEFSLQHAGEEVLEYVFQPITACISLGNSDEMGAVYGLTLFWYLMNGTWTLKRGIGTLADRLIEECKDVIRPSTPVKKILIEDGAVKGVEIDDGLIEADAVICTTTATTTLSLMPDLPDTLGGPLKTAKYKACCHVMFALENKLLPDNCYAVALPRSAGLSMAGFADNTTKSSCYAPPGCSIIHCFTYDRYAYELNEMSNKDVSSCLIKEIQKVIPEMPNEPVFSEIYRWNEAMCIAPKGMLKAVSNMKRENYYDVKGLYLAGDYVHMPSVDGSAQSGNNAAEAVMKG